MSDYPLLLFPSKELGRKTTRIVIPKLPQLPPHSRQCDRLSPKFDTLERVLAAKRITLRRTMAGIDPEMALVIETIGGVKDFFKAVKRIPGLEWLGEVEENFSSDDDFYYSNNRLKKLNGRMFLVMTNQVALGQFLSLWEHYKQDSTASFPYGKQNFFKLFQQIKDIRPWGVEDRFHETGVIEYWKDELRYDGDRMVKFETELWYRGTPEKRSESKERISFLIEEIGGHVIHECIIEEISYHSILAELPLSAISIIVGHPDTKLTECDGIMFFRPVGQMATGKGDEVGDFSEIAGDEFSDLSTPSGNPLIALLDGLPLERHQLLINRLNIEDPDGWSADYPASARHHGTMMASLICHGDLNVHDSSLPRPVYIRPILKYDPVYDSESIPEENRLANDLIRRSVRRIFEDEGDRPAAAPSVKIINLSVGDPNRQFTRIMSPFGQLLDWLSYRYNVLFVISAGNHADKSIDLDIQKNEFEQLSLTEIEKKIVNSLYDDSRNRKILSPAESINGLTIGALHLDQSESIPQQYLIDPFENLLPSPVSSFGSGYRRSVKPDLVYPGGRIFYNRPLREGVNISLEGSYPRSAPGQRVATPGMAGDLNKTKYSRGTSNSAALVSRYASLCYDSLIEIFVEQIPEIDYEPYMVPMLKAMIVHGCSWDEMDSALQTIFQDLGIDSRQIRDRKYQWLGYGAPDFNRLLDCSPQRATILGYGELNDGEAHIFKLPIPPSLGNTREWRKLTVTLAWLSPIYPKTQLYRGAKLWFEVNKGPLVISRTDGDKDTTQRGTVQHEVFDSEDYILPFTDGETLEIKVNCRKDAGEIQDPIKYGLALSLEVAEGIDIPIYNEIRTRIAPMVSIRPGAIQPRS